MGKGWFLPALRFSARTGTLLLAITIIPVPALASDLAEVTVSPGALGMSPQPAVHDFVVVTLDGTTRTTTSRMDPFMVTDARGGGAGWDITVQASTFQEWNGTAYVATGRSLPTGSLAMPAPDVHADGTDSPPPVVTPGPFAIDGAIVILATAPPGTGMGSYSFVPHDLVLTVPASAYATTYRSEIAISVTSGP